MKLFYYVKKKYKKINLPLTNLIIPIEPREKTILPSNFTSLVVTVEGKNVIIL
jgi:hypothetical protein